MRLDKTCALSIAAEPMKWISEHILNNVKSKRSLVEKISRTEKGWSTHTREGLIAYSKRVILSEGVRSKILELPKKESIHITFLDIENIVDEKKTYQNIQEFKTSRSNWIISHSCYGNYEST